MVKAIIRIVRKEGTSPEEFARHFNEHHRSLVAKLPGLRRFVINRVLSDPHGPPPAYDAVAAVRADAQSFLDMSRLRILVVDEEEIPLST